MASLLDPPDPDATDYSNPVGAALGDLYRKVTGYMTKQPEMAFRYADNPVGTETTQSMGMPAPTTYAGAVGQYVNPSTGQLTDQGRQRLADNPALGFDTGGVSPVSGLLGVLKGYHGSPHAFDRFDNAAIGSGEGAQAYGYGHYLADSEGVARGYRDQLAGFQLAFPTKAAQDAFSALPQPHQDIIQNMLKNGAKPADVRTFLGNLADGASRQADHVASGGRPSMNYGPDEAVTADAATRLAAMKSLPKSVSSGHMYEVNVNADPEHFLDWDKPLSEQHPKVRQALNDIGAAPPGASFTVRPVEGGHVVDFVDGNNKFTTSRVYQSAEDAQRQASITMKMMNRDPTGAEMVRQNQGIEAKLAEAGIPGIRYLDAGSRGAGEGSRNTVVFDPTSMEVIRRYGVAGLLGGAAAVGSRVGADGRQEQ